MRWTVTERVWQEWERVFAFLPHYLEDTHEYAWLEPVYRKLECGYADAYYVFRSAPP